MTEGIDIRPADMQKVVTVFHESGSTLSGRASSVEAPDAGESTGEVGQALEMLDEMARTLSAIDSPDGLVRIEPGGAGNVGAPTTPTALWRAITLLMPTDKELA